mgnify:FL=1
MGIWVLMILYIVLVYLSIDFLLHAFLKRINIVAILLGFFLMPLAMSADSYSGKIGMSIPLPWIASITLAAFGILVFGLYLVKQAKAGRFETRYIFTILKMAVSLIIYIASSCAI